MEAAATNVFQFIRVSGLVSGIFIIFGAWLVGRVVTRSFGQLGSRFTQRRLFLQQVATFVRFGLYLAAGTVTLLLSFDLSDQALLALGGTIAVAVGIGLKDLAAAVLAGLVVLIDQPFQVGDRVTFAGYYGEIRAIGLRSVRLVTLDDNLVTIPNNKFLTDVVACGNSGELDMMVQMDFHVAVDQDVSAAKQIVADAVTTSRYAYLRKPWAVLVTQLIVDNYFAVRLRAKVYVLDMRYEKALETDVTERVLSAFAHAGIRPPALLHRSLATEVIPARAA